MKASFRVICIFLLNSAYGQISFEQLWFGQFAETYVGTYLKISNNSNLKPQTFYQKFEDATAPTSTNVIFPIDNMGNSCIDSLINITFVVQDVISKDGKKFSGIVSAENIPVFLLKDINSELIVYYKYINSYYWLSDFPFLIGGCKPSSFSFMINRKIDDFTSEIDFRSAQKIGGYNLPFVMIKTILKGKILYFLKLTTRASTISIGERGVIILFEDGTKITKPNVLVDYNSNASTRYDYFAFIPLTLAELAILKTKKVKKYRLFIYDDEFNAFEQNLLNYFAKSISELK